jgi:hypothetical protein
MNSKIKNDPVYIYIGVRVSFLYIAPFLEQISTLEFLHFVQDVPTNFLNGKVGMKKKWKYRWWTR